MAHKETIQNNHLKSVLTGANHFYTVSTNVGYGYRNMSEDVRLVQFFINKSIETYSEDWRDCPAKLEEDGLFGGKTWGAIKAFQRFTAETVVDGMISPVDGRKIYTPRNNRLYTMYFLNWYYWLQFPQYFQDIRSDPSIPAPLKDFLSRPLPNLF